MYNRNEMNDTTHLLKGQYHLNSEGDANSSVSSSKSKSNRRTIFPTVNLKKKLRSTTTTAYDNYSTNSKSTNTNRRYRSLVMPSSTATTTSSSPSSQSRRHSLQVQPRERGALKDRRLPPSSPPQPQQRQQQRQQQQQSQSQSQSLSYKISPQKALSPSTLSTYSTSTSISTNTSVSSADPSSPLSTSSSSCTETSTSTNATATATTTASAGPSATYMNGKGQHCRNHNISIPTLPTASLSSSLSSDSDSAAVITTKSTAARISPLKSKPLNDDKSEDASVSANISISIETNTNTYTPSAPTITTMKSTNDSTVGSTKGHKGQSQSKNSRNRDGKISRNICNNNSTNTLEKRLFHALHTSQVNNPSMKEYKECWAFANAVKTFYSPKNNSNSNIDLILDVAGGHDGALGALLLILLKSTSKCVVIDPACHSVQGGVERAWGNEILCAGGENESENESGGEKKQMKYRYECLRTGLCDELDKAINGKSPISPERILVVACHASQHLSDETLEIACSFGVHVTVMPCCQKDLTNGSFKAIAGQLGMSIGVLADILAAGKVLSWKNGREIGVRYQVKMKTIDEKITPQNLMILAKAVDLDVDDNCDACKNTKIQEAHEKLSRAYREAHSNAKRGVSSIREKISASICVKSLGAGIATGVILSIIWSRRR